MLDQDNNSDVMLVDENDQPRGTMNKFKAHQLGALHRAFSIMVYRKQGGRVQVLLHKRQRNKYHSGGLWTNACCSHPQLGTSVEQSAKARLYYEMGIEADLTYVDTFYYRAEVGNGLIEHEIDHLFIAESRVERPPFNPQEVEETRWVSWDDLVREVDANADYYTAWFPKLLEIIGRHHELMDVNPNASETSDDD